MCPLQQRTNAGVVGIKKAGQLDQGPDTQTRHKEPQIVHVMGDEGGLKEGEEVMKWKRGGEEERRRNKGRRKVRATEEGRGNGEKGRGNEEEGKGNGGR